MFIFITFNTFNCICSYICGSTKRGGCFYFIYIIYILVIYIIININVTFVYIIIIVI